MNCSDDGLPTSDRRVAGLGSDVRARRFVVKTLGCKANLADSLGLARELRARGWTDAEGEALDLCIVNSCTVTDEADRQSRQMASRLARLHPGARVVVTGCAAEVDPERIAASRGIDYVVGTRDRARLVELVLECLEQAKSDRGEVLGVAAGYEEIASRHPMDREWPSLAGHGSGASRFARVGMGHEACEPALGMGHGGSWSHTRAFLKIQEGCNAFCTYCIIPYGRGPSRSLEVEGVLARVREICATGTREIVLTGTNIGDYGMDLGEGYSLEGLIRAILSETKLERLRLSSLDPVEITPGILELLEREPRLCPHLHVSLQSPLDRILKQMKRKYNATQARESLEAIARLKSKGGPVFLGMDLITGFPGETEAEFEAGYAWLASLPWSRLHVFPYSERTGTPATRLPGTVPARARSQRAARLNALSLSRSRELHERLVGRELGGVLLEKPQTLKGLEGEWMQGYSPGYVRVRVPARPELRNRVVSVRPEGVHLDHAAYEASLVGTIS